jgi:hypothetical protein
LGKREGKLIKLRMNERINGCVSDKFGEMVREKRGVCHSVETEDDLETSREINEGL